MILAFSKFFPWPGGGETNFRSKIVTGQKIHTIRLNHRWQPGMKIHFWEGNPRNVGKKVEYPPEPFSPFIGSCELWQWQPSPTRPEPETFNRKEISLSDQFQPDHEMALPLVHGIELFSIGFLTDEHNGTESIMVTIGPRGKHVVSIVEIDRENNCLICDSIHASFVLSTLATLDGFDRVFDFVRWFDHRRKNVKILDGQIIHWTPFRYATEV